MPPAQRSDTPPRTVKPRSTGDCAPLRDMVTMGAHGPVRLDDRHGRSARAFDDDGLAEEVDPLVVGSGPDAHRVTRSCRIDGRLDRRIGLRDEKHAGRGDRLRRRQSQHPGTHRDGYRQPPATRSARHVFPRP